MTAEGRVKIAEGTGPAPEETSRLPETARGDQSDATDAPMGRGGKVDGDGSDDPVEGALEEPFPASDPPSRTATTAVGPPGGEAETAMDEG